MKAHIALFYIVFILILSNILALFTVINKVNINTEYSGFTKMDSSINSRELFFYNYDYMIIQNEGIKINSEVSLIDTSLMKVSIHDILNTEKKNIFIRFSSNDCSSCIEMIINMLEKYPENIKNRFILLADYPTVKAFHLHIRKLTNSIRAYCITPEYIRLEGNSSLGIPLEGKGILFAFVLNESKQTTYFYTIDKNEPQTVKRYFDAVLKKIDEG